VEFDSFFVGDGSAKLMDGYLEEMPSLHQQISIPDEPSIVSVDDRDRFQAPVVDVDDNLVWAYTQYKKKAYDIFDFVKIKSDFLFDRPIKLTDLVLEESDRHLIDYLQDKVTDFYAWKAIAELQAYASMSVPAVRFVARHECALCKANNDRIFRVDALLKLLCRGGTISHSYCNCDLFPVVYRETYSGPLSGYLNVDMFIHPISMVEVFDCPVEYYGPEMDSLLEDLPGIEVVFKDMSSEKDNMVVRLEDETLYVHNSYVHNFGPMEFLKQYVQAAPTESSVDPTVLDLNDLYILNGQEAALYKGHYYNIKTGKRLK
jgi:hypothetical protein